MTSTRDIPVAGYFPTTRLSILERLRGEPEVRQQAFAALAGSYWKPIYKYVRYRHQLAPADAEDATQSFLAAAFEKRFFEGFDPSKARFRTFLKTCLDRHISKLRAREAAAKRGGDVRHVPLDFPQAEAELSPGATWSSGDPDEYFRQELVRSLFEYAVDQVRAECATAGNARRFELFECYDLETAEPVTYQDLAARFGIPVTTVTNELAAARKRFRHHALDKLSQISGSADEYRAEARELLGVEVE